MDDLESTLARAERARVNGAKSRGPVTAEGKERSSANARRHGLYAERHLAAEPGDAALIEELRHGLVAEHGPEGIIEHRLLARLAAVMWKLEQAEAMECALVRARKAVPVASFEAATQLPPLLQCLPEFLALERHQARLGREFAKLCAMVSRWPARPEADAERWNEPSAPTPDSRNEPSRPDAELRNEPTNIGQIKEMTQVGPGPATPLRNEPGVTMTEVEIDAALDEVDRLLDQDRLEEAMALSARLRGQQGLRGPV